MRFRTLTLSFIAALGLAALAIGVYQWSYAIRQVGEARQGRALVDFLTPAMKFSEALALERTQYFTALNGKPASAVEDSKAIAQRARETDARLAESFAAAGELPEPLRDEVDDALNRAKDILLGARLDADPLIDHRALPASVAAETLRLRYWASDDADDRALIAVEHRLLAIDSWFVLRVELLRLADDFRDLAGDRSELLTQFAATGRQFSGGDADRATEIAGAMDVTWRRVQETAVEIGSPQISAGVEATKRDFFGVAEPVYQAMMISARVGYPPPTMDLAAWRDWDEDKLAVALSARDPVLAEMSAQLDAMRSAAQLAARMGLAGLALLVLGVVGAGLFIEQRMLRPIGALTAALDDVAHRGGEIAALARPAQAMAERFAQQSDEIGSLARAVLSLRDHTNDISDLNARFDALIENMPQGVSLYDSDDRLVVANRRFGEIYGLNILEAWIGKSSAEIAAFGAALGYAPTPSVDQQLRSALDGAGARRIANRIISLQNGRIVAANGLVMPGGGWLSTHFDITERRRAEEQIAFLADHDALTGLANRSLFARDLEIAIERARRGAATAVMGIDLDRFKAVNDLLGHASGDELLRQVAARLSAYLRATDRIARFGGDEFAVLLDCRDIQLAYVADRLIAELSRPYNINGQSVEISASIGIAVAPNDGTTPGDLLRAADLAMYAAKTDGRCGFRFFEPEMDEKMQLRRMLEHDMRAALDGGDFELNYQPIVEARSGRVAACEALLRWNHPTRGRISPADFIPLAEDSGLIVDIGAWALRQACFEAIAWPKDVKVSVNLSPREFNGPRLLADIVGALEASHLPPSRLEVEITERVMIVNTEATLATLTQLRGLGVAIAMDDFGSGYSSLSYLRRFPFDKIKIDQAFVHDLTPRSDAVAIVRAITDLARALRMRTTAEGVETVEQCELLSREGCDEIQGYLISRPIRSAEIRAFLAAPALMRKIA